MEKLIKANLDCLPNVPIHIIISYLRTSEVLGSLCLVSRYFFKLLAGSKPALVSCILDVIGTTPESKKRVNELSPDALKFLLARGLPLLWKKCYELPFYGYAADKGCDQNEYFSLFMRYLSKERLNLSYILPNLLLHVILLELLLGIIFIFKIRWISSKWQDHLFKKHIWNIRTIIPLQGKQ